MAVLSVRVDVEDTPTLLAENAAAHAEQHVGEWAVRSYLLKNRTATAPVFLGADDVTATTGFEWAPSDGPLEIELEPGERLYGVAASIQTVHVLSQGR